MTRVRVEPRPFDWGRRKNDTFTFSAPLPTKCWPRCRRSVGHAVTKCRPRCFYPLGHAANEVFEKEAPKTYLHRP